MSDKLQLVGQAVYKDSIEDNDRQNIFR